MTATTKVETQVWEQNPDRPEGYLRVARTKTIREVYDELVAIVGEYGDGHDEYFQISSHLGPDAFWPQGQRLVVFPVTGDSEGHYIHVEVLQPDGLDVDRILLILGKTFDGWDAAWAFAKRLAEILNV